MDLDKLQPAAKLYAFHFLCTYCRVCSAGPTGDRIPWHSAVRTVARMASYELANKSIHLPSLHRWIRTTHHQWSRRARRCLFLPTRGKTEPRNPPCTCVGTLPPRGQIEFSSYPSISTISAHGSTGFHLIACGRTHLVEVVNGRRILDGLVLLLGHVLDRGDCWVIKRPTLGTSVCQTPCDTNGANCILMAGKGVHGIVFTRSAYQTIGVLHNFAFFGKRFRTSSKLVLE